MTERDLKIFKSLLTGGVAIGGGAMLTANLINYLNHLNDEDDTDDDDDTLYVYKKASQTTDNDDKGLFTGEGLAYGIPASVLGGVGAAALVNYLYTQFRKKKAQDELDKAQRVFVDAQGYATVDPKKKKKKDKETEKSASTTPAAPTHDASITPVEAFQGGGVALPLLLMLASGIATHKILQSKFPVKEKKPKKPRRIEVVDAPEEENEKEGTKENSGAPIKVASYDSDGTELLIRTLYSTKSASSDIANLVSNIAAQGPEPFLKTASAIGYFAALDTNKGAITYNKDNAFKEHVAITYLTKKASIANQTALTAALEFTEMFPSTYAAVQALSEKKQDALYKAACILGRSIRHQISSEFGLVADSTDEALYKKASEESSEESLEETLTNLAADSIIPGSSFVLGTRNGSKENPKKDDDDDDDDDVKISATSEENLKLLESIPSDVLEKILSVD